MFSNDCDLLPQQQQQRFNHHNPFFFDEKEEDLVPQTEARLNKILTEIFIQVSQLMTSNVKEVQNSTKPTRINRPTNHRNTLDSLWPASKRARISHDSTSFQPQSSGERNEIEPASSNQNNQPLSFGWKSNSAELEEESGRNGERRLKNYRHSIHAPDKENLNLESPKISDLKSRFQCKHPRSNSHSKSDRETVQVLNPVISNIHTPKIQQRRLSDLKTKSRQKESCGLINRCSSDPKLPFSRSPVGADRETSRIPLDLSTLKSRFQYKLPARGSMNRNSNNPKAPFSIEGNDKDILSHNNNSCSSSQLANLRTENYQQRTELHKIDLSQFSNSSTFTMIGQLDLKFIIARIHDDCDQQGQRDGGLIVAFDQHAVHERIRIEKFLKDMCTGKFKIKKLIHRNNDDLDYNQERNERGIKINRRENSVPILVNIIEFEGLLKFQKQFERWGIIYEISTNETQEARYRNEEDEGQEDESAFRQIYLVAVPELIWERVKSDKLELVKKILRGCLAFFEDHGRDLSLNLRPLLVDHHHLVPVNDHSRSDHESISRDWFKFVKDCPTVLVDLLNSKACRGSIMFGDELDDSACSKLIVQLSRTHLPFCCAHGRPTCFPLFKFGSDLGSHSDPKASRNSSLNSSLDFPLDLSFDSDSDSNLNPNYFKSHIGGHSLNEQNKHCLDTRSGPIRLENGDQDHHHNIQQLDPLLPSTGTPISCFNTFSRPPGLVDNSNGDHHRCKIKSKINWKSLFDSD